MIGIILALALIGVVFSSVQIGRLVARLRPIRRLIIARALRKALPARAEIKAERAGAMFQALRAVRSDVAQVREVHIHAPPNRSASTNLPPGRQNISMPLAMVRKGPFMATEPWKPAIPADAKSAPWSDVHRFAVGATERQKSPGGRYLSEEPPIALVCVGCELEQPPLDDERACPYCGLRMKAHGSRVFWWRDPVEVSEWRATK